MIDNKKVTYEVQEQYNKNEPWISSSYELDDIDGALAIKRSLVADYPDVKFRIVRKTLTVEIME